MRFIDRSVVTIFYIQIMCAIVCNKFGLFIRKISMMTEVCIVGIVITCVLYQIQFFSWHRAIERVKQFI